MELETRVSKYASYRKNKGKEEVKTSLIIKKKNEENKRDNKSSMSTIPISYDDVIKGVKANEESNKKIVKKHNINLSLILIVGISVLLVATIVALIIILISGR